MHLTKLINDYLSKNLSNMLKQSEYKNLTDAEEIRIRIGQPMYIRCGIKELYIGGNNAENAYRPTMEDIQITINKMSDYSVYAFNEEIKKGYITLSGGYRVGICGSVVYDNNRIITIKDISSLNIRISREVKGCADKAVNGIYDKGRFLSTLIISPPACGKTTLLRDMIRQLSDKGFCIGLVDERSEIAGAYMGQAQNDVGSHTDVLDGCKKDIGMYMLLRSMGPEIIAVDEIGSDSEIACIKQVVNSGVGLLCTVHAYDKAELMQKPGFKEIVSQRLFKRYIVLSSYPHVGTIDSILDEEMKEICF